MLAAPHPEHYAMFYVEQNLFLLPVVSDEGMQGVTMGHPANQAWVGGQGDHCVALNADERNTNTNKRIVNCQGFRVSFFNLISSAVRVYKHVSSRHVPQGECVCVCVCVCVWCSCVRELPVYLRFFRKDAGSLASSVLTRPNSCMTLSSCLRSSWPFSRNMNSWPLLPAEGATKQNIDTHCSKNGDGII